jgi:hypothetical protein
MILFTNSTKNYLHRIDLPCAPLSFRFRLKNKSYLSKQKTEAEVPIVDLNILNIVLC